MERNQIEILSVAIQINQSPELVWETWNDEKHMPYWMFVSDEYEVKDAKNDLKIGGGFSYKMCSKDGLMKFDYSGTYTSIDLKKFLAFTLNDGRKVEVIFSEIEDIVQVEIKFEAVSEQDLDVQLQGWKEILRHFKSHVEKLNTNLFD